MIAAFIFSLIFLAFIIVVVTQPDEFRVMRSLMMDAPPEKIFPQVNNLRNWEKWSPWVKLDPNSKSFFEGAEAGEGAYMRWVGNYKVGEGSMQIIESRPYDFIKLRLDFLKPMQATNNAEFTFRNDGGKTEVTWSMYGKNSFIGKAMGLFFNCEKMAGGQFEKGLSGLKSLVESK